MTDVADDTDFDNDDDGDGGQGPKALRDQVKKLTKQLKDLTAERDTLQKTTRQHAVSSALEKHGAKPRLARFYDGGATDDESVLAWLKDNGEDFGWTPPDDDEDDDGTADAAEAVARAAASGTPPSPGSNAELLTKLKTYTPAQLRAEGLI